MKATKTKQEIKIREFETTRDYAGRKILGVCKVVSRKGKHDVYFYDYPEMRAVAAFMMKGDNEIVAQKVGCTLNMVDRCFSGKSWNPAVFELMEKMAEMNAIVQMDIDKLTQKKELLEITVEQEINEAV